MTGNANNTRAGYEAEGVVSSSPTSNAVALVERLRSKVLFWNPITEIEQKRLRNPDGPEAADVIQSQAARIAELEAETARLLNAFDGIVEGEGGE